MDIHCALDSSYAALGEIGQRELSERLRFELTARFVMDSAGGYAGKRVLELGSSIGLHAILAKELGAAAVVGVDKFIFPEAGENAFYVSPENLVLLRRGWESHGIDIKRHDLADPLPFANSSFDLVVCNAVIEHLHGIHRQVFAEASRVLAPSGSFVFTTPNLASLLKRVRFLIGRSPSWDIKDFFESGAEFTGHTREFTLDECRFMLRKSGFEISRITSHPSYFRWDWLKNPQKAHNVIFQLVSRLSLHWGDLILAAGKKSGGVLG